LRQKTNEKTPSSLAMGGMQARSTLFSPGRCELPFSLNSTYPGGLYGHPFGHSRSGLLLFHQVCEVFDHDGLSVGALRAKIGENRLQPGLIGTHTDIDGTVASIWQVTN
jgi:hypothetical protein